MKYSQATQGRVFIIRLENGDIVHEEIEHLAKKESITAATVVIVGGADRGSKLVVGPVDGGDRPVTPREHTLPDVHEVAGVGNAFPG